MTQSKTLKATTAVALTALLAVAAATTTFADSHEKGELERAGGPNHEIREQIHEALENDDYDTWAELSKDAPFADQISPELFAAMTELHELKESGAQREEIKSLAEELEDELGIELPHKPGKRGGQGGNCNHSQETPESVE